MVALAISKQGMSKLANATHFRHCDFRKDVHVPCSKDEEGAKPGDLATYSKADSGPITLEDILPVISKYVKPVSEDTVRMHIAFKDGNTKPHIKPKSEAIHCNVGNPSYAPPSYNPYSYQSAMKTFPF